MTAAITDADRLAERVALRMCEVAGFDPAVDLVAEQARAAIAVVLEEVVALIKERPDVYPDYSDYDLAWCSGSEHERSEIMEAIRALGEQS